MNPVRKGAGNAQLSQDFRPELKKAGEAKKGKVCRENDSSDESQSDEVLGKSEKPRATMKQRKKAKEKVSVAPHSTSNPVPSATEPKIRSSRREAFQEKIKSDMEAGKKNPYRKREFDLSSHRPTLKALEKTQPQKELTSGPVKRSEAADVNIEFTVLSVQDAKNLVQILRTNTSIRSLKLMCNLGGKTAEFVKSRGAQQPDSMAMIPGQIELDGDSLKDILDSCPNLQNLDLSGCRLQEHHWMILGDTLKNKATLRSLTLGNGDYMNGDKFKVFLMRLQNLSSLRDITIKNTTIFQTVPLDLLSTIGKHGKLQSVNLINLDVVGTQGFGLGDFFEYSEGIGTSFSHLSLSGSKPYFGDSSKEWLIERIISKAQKAEKLLSVDLSGCGYSEDESNILAKIVDALPALQEINMEGNTVSDTARASFEKTCKRNRERAERAAAAAFDLLVPNSAVPPSHWPEELSRVLAQNAPVATLVSLAALIGEDPISLHRMDPSDASGRASDKTS